MAKDRPLLPRVLWVQDHTVFLTPKDVEFQKRNIDKNVFSRELDTLPQMAGLRAHRAMHDRISGTYRSGPIQGAVGGQCSRSFDGSKGAYYGEVCGLAGGKDSEFFCLLGGVNGGGAILVRQASRTGCVAGHKRIAPQCVKGQAQPSVGQTVVFCCKGSCPPVRTSTPVEAQLTRNVRLSCCHEVFDCLLKGGFVKVNWDLVRCRPCEPPHFFCKKCGCMGKHFTEFHQPLEVADVRPS